MIHFDNPSDFLSDDVSTFYTVDILHPDPSQTLRPWAENNLQAIMTEFLCLDQDKSLSSLSKDQELGFHASGLCDATQQHGQACSSEKSGFNAVVTDNLPALSQSKPTQQGSSGTRMVKPNVYPLLSPTKSSQASESLVLHDVPPYCDSPKLYQCTICGKSYKRNSHLERHIKLHDSLKSYHCSECDKVFYNNQSLKIHIKTHTGEKSYLCEICGKSYGESYGLNSHKVCHSSATPYSCTLCNKAFGSRSRLKQHSRTHIRTLAKVQGNDNLFRYQCGLCDKRFLSRTELNHHLRIHTGYKPYQCPQCTRRFLYPISLEYHIRTHTGEKPFQCKQCLKHFRDMSTLRQHKVVHETGRKRLPCPKCGRTFLLKKSLKRHPCIDKFPCRYCSSIFQSKEDFEAHKSTHTSEQRRKHVCTKCGNKYSKRVRLLNHICGLSAIPLPHKQRSVKTATSSAMWRKMQGSWCDEKGEMLFETADGRSRIAMESSATVKSRDGEVKEKIKLVSRSRDIKQKKKLAMAARRVRHVNFLLRSSLPENCKDCGMNYFEESEDLSLQDPTISYMHMCKNENQPSPEFGFMSDVALKHTCGICGITMTEQKFRKHWHRYAGEHSLPKHCTKCGVNYLQESKELYDKDPTIYYTHTCKIKKEPFFESGCQLNFSETASVGVVKNPDLVNIVEVKQEVADESYFQENFGGRVDLWK